MTRAQLTQDLRASRERLFALIKHLSEEQFRSIPDGEQWNVATHLAHLLRCERLYVDRMRLAVHRDRAPVESTGSTNDDEPAFAQRLAVPQIVHGMQAARRDLTSILDQIDDAALERGIVHFALGRMTLRQMAAKMAAHEQEHAATIETLLPRLPAQPEPFVPLVPRS